jgi:phosphopantothenoylcysteine decarboxylase/phosphopantothenate--cysteine ligase
MRTEGAPRPTACPDPLVGRRILVAITGSIAAVKMPLLVSALAKRGA